MNVLGHTYVATAWPSDDTAFLLGAVLPDLASMARVRLERARPEGRLGEGIRCHHRVDSVFHADLAFRRGSATLREDLLREGLGTGPARAIGHAGWELLLDGALVGSPTEDAYRRALALAPQAVDHVATGDRDRWLAFVGHRSIPTLSLRYDDPAWVARRLCTMLEHRPRLRFEPADVETVTAVLRRHAAVVRSAAPSVLAGISEAARSTGG